MGAQQSPRLPSLLFVSVIVAVAVFLLVDRGFLGKARYLTWGTMPDSPKLARSGHMVYVGDFVEAWKVGNLSAAQLHARLGLKDVAVIPALFTRLNETWKGLELVEGEPYFHIRAPIPVIGTNTMNRALMLRRLIYSIDVPVQKIVLIVNSMPGEVGKQAEQEMLAEVSELQAVIGQQFLEVVVSGCNRGCAGGWNSIIYATRDAPWWLIINDDAAFRPGALRSVADHVNSQPDVVIFEFAGYQVFVLTRLGLQEIGTFDENIWPAYHEDCDYALRVMVSGKKKGAAPPDFSNIHGDQDDQKAAVKTPFLDYGVRNGHSHYNNAYYYSMKWNVTGHCANVEEEMFRTPFNDPKRTVASWTLDKGLRARSMSCWEPTNEVYTQLLEGNYSVFVGQGGIVATVDKGAKALISLWPNGTKEELMDPKVFESVDDADICVSPFARLSSLDTIA